VDSGAVSLPHVVKMDVEGAEGEVLAGAEKTLRRTEATWFIALHGDAAKDQCETLLRGAGYALFSMRGEELTAPLVSLPIDEIYARKRSR
jgi:hypothetical protein